MVKPVPLGVEVLKIILFLRLRVAVVAVALVVWKIPDVPKFAPEDEAFK